LPCGQKSVSDEVRWLMDSGMCYAWSIVLLLSLAVDLVYVLAQKVLFFLGCSFFGVWFLCFFRLGEVFHFLAFL
jgi:hypothetical protein